MPTVTGIKSPTAGTVPFHVVFDPSVVSLTHTSVNIYKVPRFSTAPTALHQEQVVELES